MLWLGIINITIFSILWRGSICKKFKEMLLIISDDKYIITSGPKWDRGSDKTPEIVISIADQ